MRFFFPSDIDDVGNTPAWYPAMHSIRFVEVELDRKFGILLILTEPLTMIDLSLDVWCHTVAHEDGSGAGESLACLLI